MSLSQVESKLQEITRNSKVLNVGIWEEEEEDRPWEKQQMDFDEEEKEITLPSKVHIILSNMIYMDLYRKEWTVSMDDKSNWAACLLPKS
jgi:hypothetical protein